MAKFKKAGPGTCIYCFDHFDTLTWDHVFPKAWYTDDDISNYEKWKVPSCQKCNNRLSKVEEDLLLRVALCLNPNDPRFKEISLKARRSIKPEFGKNERDILARKNRRLAIEKDILRHVTIPDYGLLPNMPFELDKTDQNKLSIGIDPKLISAFAEKLARGIVFKTMGNYITSDYIIKDYQCEKHKIQPEIDYAQKCGQRIKFGNTVILVYAIVPDDNISSMIYVDFWEHILFSIIVTKKNQ
ncbi:MAG: hypothetical protein KAR42_07005 [candidate division Zixibacteria bacterium]|nr:hypothetical protein [candidate division Zixibacteria bacterium]